MPIDERLAQEIKQAQQRLLNEGRLPTTEKLQQYYTTFQERFGPERLRSLDGEALLEHMHGSGNVDSMVYWLEFKNDEEFPAIFGSIAGGSALKFGVFRFSKTGEWTTRDQSNYPVTVSTDQAIAIARKHRDQLLRGLELLQQLPSNGTDDDYRALQEQMDAEAPDVSRLAWGHKYFSLLFPDKLDDYHAENYQRFHLIKLLQLPPEGEGRYLCAGRYVAIAAELDMPINHLTSILNQRHGRPYKYWRIGTSEYEQPIDYWPLMRDGNCVAIGWSKAIQDLSLFSREEDMVEYVRRKLLEHYHIPQSVVARKANEIKRFVNVTGNPAFLSVGDLVLAAKGETILGIGRVVGGYRYARDVGFPHYRPVQWLSFQEWKLPQREGLLTTVCELKKYPVNLLEVERRILEANVPSPLSPKLEGVVGRIQSILERKGQVILYGPPGTGKTY